MAYTVDQIMGAIKIQESNGNYTARSSTSSASGAYQYIDGTWNGYGGYAHAWQAPAAVQDQRMRADVTAAYEHFNHDWERVIAAHFAGEGGQAGDKSGWNYTPGDSSNPTVRGYVDSVIGHIQGGGGGAAPKSGGAGVTSPNPGTDADYGYITTLANSIPELKNLLDKAKNDPNGQWTPERFTRAVQDTNWWKKTGESSRAAQVLRATDPKTYWEKVNQSAASVMDMALQMGVRGLDYKAIGRDAMVYGWSEAQLREILASHWSAKGGSSGQAAQFKDKLLQMSKQYGIEVNNAWLDAHTKQLLKGNDTMDTYSWFFKKRAKSTYPGFADEIDRGMTVAEIAQPYMAMKARILEVPETMVSLGSPDIHKALTYKQPGTGPGGKPEAGHAPMQLWQFEQELKKNPLYDKTKGALQDTYNMLGEIGKGWGFVSG